jgi:FAD/FMN-containing dehydrogenase
VSGQQQTTSADRAAEAARASAWSAPAAYTGERLAAEDARFAPDMARHLAAYHLMEPFITGKNVLEAGCGEGYGAALMARHAARVVGVDYNAPALELARARLGAGLTGFELMNRFSLDLVARHMPQLPAPLPGAAWTVLLEQSDNEGEAQARHRFEALLGDALEEGLISDAVVAESLAQSQNLWHIRESIPLAQSEEGLNIKHDIALPVSAIADFVEQTDAALQAAIPGVRLVDFGHLGDGNLHYNVQAPEGGDARRFLAEQEHAVNTIVYDAVQRFGGSISAEHGVGQLKREDIVERKSPVAIALMRQIKRALDPHNRLNPNRVLAAG